MKGSKSGSGSPPPARSGRGCASAARVGLRFTSACAERTRPGGCGSGRGAVHLRLRGADGSSPRSTPLIVGSPPPARSGRFREQGPGRPARFTSACAERTRRTAAAGDRAPVHLRLRGADAAMSRTIWRSAGSPPPARSGLGRVVGELGGGRFTSACAERTLATLFPCRKRSVHLRLRGADIGRVSSTSAWTGSPPPARSGPHQVVLVPAVQRFTSACAERTRQPATCLQAPTVHLRLRGADQFFASPSHAAVGSPPPARSGRGIRGAQPGLSRFTSACAERTLRELRR